MTNDGDVIAGANHAAGVERLIRNQMWKNRPQERFYDAMEWLYGWNVKNCLASA